VVYFSRFGMLYREKSGNPGKHSGARQSTATALTIFPAQFLLNKAHAKDTFAFPLQGPML
jgi:hypothetical protein